MGACFSGIPSPNIDAAVVAKTVAKRGAQIVAETREKETLFKEEMHRHAPNPYLVPKDLTGGHDVSLTEGKDDEKKVRTVALTAATGDKVKEETRNDVWNAVEPDVSSQLSEHNELVRKGAFAAAHKASDKASDAALDQLVKKLMKQIEEGKEVSNPEEGEGAEHGEHEHAHATTAHADDKHEHHDGEHHDGEVEKKEQAQENAV